MCVAAAHLARAASNTRPACFGAGELTSQNGCRRYMRSSRWLCTLLWRRWRSFLMAAQRWQSCPRAVHLRHRIRHLIARSVCMGCLGRRRHRMMLVALWEVLLVNLKPAIPRAHWNAYQLMPVPMSEVHSRTSRDSDLVELLRGAATSTFFGHLGQLHVYRLMSR